MTAPTAPISMGACTPDFDTIASATTTAPTAPALQPDPRSLNIADSTEQTAPAPAGLSVADVLDRAANIALCAFDDRPRSRFGHPSHFDWEDGYRDGTRAAWSALRSAAEAARAQVQG